MMPIWANPLDAPPPSAKATTACGLGGGVIWVLCRGGLTGEVLLGHALRIRTEETVSAVRKTEEKEDFIFRRPLCKKDVLPG